MLIRMKTIEQLKKRMWYSYKESKKFCTTIYPFFKSNLPPEDDYIAKIWCNGLAWQFSCGFQISNWFGASYLTKCQTNILFWGKCNSEFVKLSKILTPSGLEVPMIDHLGPLQ